MDRPEHISTRHADHSGRGQGGGGKHTTNTQRVLDVINGHRGKISVAKGRPLHAGVSARRRVARIISASQFAGSRVGQGPVDGDDAAVRAVLGPGRRRAVGVDPELKGARVEDHLYGLAGRAERDWFAC